MTRSLVQLVAQFWVKWHRNSEQSEVILNMDNGHSKSMEKEKPKKEK